jgi:hypothetical protein
VTIQRVVQRRSGGVSIGKLQGRLLPSAAIRGGAAIFARPVR